jgi:Mn-dependent DtxR family transcriptional regulator
MPNLTENDWLQAMAEAGLTDQADGYSMHEIADGLEVTVATARQMVKQLIEAGKAEYAGRRQVTRMDKIATRIPVYRLKT